jgi:hypothetical protein
MSKSRHLHSSRSKANNRPQVSMTSSRCWKEQPRRNLKKLIRKSLIHSQLDSNIHRSKRPHNRKIIRNRLSKWWKMFFTISRRWYNISIWKIWTKMTLAILWIRKMKRCWWKTTGLSNYSSNLNHPWINYSIKLQLPNKSFRNSHLRVSKSITFIRSNSNNCQIS